MHITSYNLRRCEEEVYLDNYSQKKCGFCGEGIPRDASRCPYCGSILEVTVDQPYGMPEQQQNNAGSNGIGDEQRNIENPAGSSENMYNGSEKQPSENPDNVYRQQYGQASQPGMGQRTEYRQGSQYGQRPYYPHNQQAPIYQSNNGKKPLSNGLKVFLTMLFTLLPGIGQLAGIITAIVFMSADGDTDRRSFGIAILVASLAMFVLSCVGCFTLGIIGENYSLY